MDAGLAAERIDHQTGIVGEGGAAGRDRGGHRLDARVVGEGACRFPSGSAQAELAGRLRGDAIRREQLAHFGELAGIVGGDHQRAAEFAMVPRLTGRTHITAIFCKSTSFSMPLRASASSAWNWSSLNGVFSAVAWISTMLPEPVMTKLASVSASESSA